MSYEFLQNYKIPNVEDWQMMGGEGHVPELWPTGTDVHIGNYQQEVQTSYYEHPNRFIPAGMEASTYCPMPSRPQKRKYKNGPGTPKMGEQAADGKEVLYLGRDASYPDVLNDLIHPLHCDLCKTQMNSKYSAKDHYESKVHDKGLTTWLNKNYTEKGLEPPTLKRFVKQGPTGPDAFHCEQCDLKLTSLTHANQHYAGRRHRMVAYNKAKPSGSGYYNSEGKWVRTGTKVHPTGVDNKRFGIGGSFISANATATATGTDATVTAAATTTSSALATPAPPPLPPPILFAPPPPPPPPDTTTTVEGAVMPVTVITTGIAPQNERLYCKICDVRATSAQQMEMHMQGSKHRKKLKLSATEIPPDSLLGPIDDSILASINENEQQKTLSDLSMYRTPTGSYYCKTCNISMSHITVLQQHLTGKKHVRRMTDEKEKVHKKEASGAAV